MKEQDLVKQAIDAIYEELKMARHRARLEVDRYLEFVYVKAIIGHRVEERRFHSGIEIYTPWMIQHDRLPWIASMIREGYTKKRIGIMMGFSPSTIYKDVKFMRENRPEMLDEDHPHVNRSKMILNVRHYVTNPANHVALH